MYVQVDKYDITILYVDHARAHFEIVRAKVGKGGTCIQFQG